MDETGCHAADRCSRVRNVIAVLIVFNRVFPFFRLFDAYLRHSYINGRRVFRRHGMLGRNVIATSRYQYNVPADITSIKTQMTDLVISSASISGSSPSTTSFQSASVGPHCPLIESESGATTPS